MMKKYIFCLIAVAAMFTTACKNNDGKDLVVPVTGVTLEQTELLITQGVNKILRTVIMPENATNKDVTWSSDNETAVKINPVTGELSTLSTGTAIITVTTDDGGFTATRTVQVINVPVTGVMITEDEVNLALGDKKTLTAIVLSAAASNKAVTWSSDKETVAVIDSTTGGLTAIALGTAIITATTVENGFTASCTVNVVAEGGWNGFDITIQDYMDDFVNQGVPLDQVAPNQTLTSLSNYTLPDVLAISLNGYQFQFATNFYREQAGFTSALCDNKSLEYCIQLKNNAPTDSYVEFPELQDVGKITVYGYCPNASNDLKLNLLEKGAGDVWTPVESGYLYSLTSSGKDRMYEFKYSSNVPVTLRLSRDPSTNFLGRIFRIVVEKY